MLLLEKTNRRAVGMALCHTGECCEKLGRTADAAGLFQKAGEIIPNYKEAQAGLARCRGR